jgi:hypothetical protein
MRAHPRAMFCPPESCRRLIELAAPKLRRSQTQGDPSHGPWSHCVPTSIGTRSKNTSVYVLSGVIEHVLTLLEFDSYFHRNA